MSRSRGTRTRRNGLKNPSEPVIKPTELIDASASCSVSIYNTHTDHEEVYTKEYGMAGLSDITPKSPEQAAKITVSFDLSSKSYGNGPSIMCSVTLVCNQDEDSVGTGFNIARAICEQEGEIALLRARDIFDRVTRES